MKDRLGANLETPQLQHSDSNRRGDLSSHPATWDFQFTRHLLHRALEASPHDIAQTDIALLNLLCAPTLRGAESLDIPDCLRRLDQLAKFVEFSTERAKSAHIGTSGSDEPEPIWRMRLLITRVKRDFGAEYSPNALSDLGAEINTPFCDSRENFIHGLLDPDKDNRRGTCASIPVLIVAVARRLKYPVRLAVTRTHVYAKWESNAAIFNIEASNPAGMTNPPDDHYRAFASGMTAAEQASRYYLRSLSPCEEFSQFLKTRVFSLRDEARYEESFLWSARALQYGPDDPHFAAAAHYVLDLALRHRFRRKNPNAPIPACDAHAPFVVNAGSLLLSVERSLFFTIVGHRRESLGDVEGARCALEDACRHNLRGSNEQRDIQRFFRKHGLRQTAAHSPRTIAPFPRHFNPACQSRDVRRVLMGLADRFEREGNFLLARNALEDLYLIDPCDADVFDRARAIERHQIFMAQSLNHDRRYKQPRVLAGICGSSNVFL